MMCAIRQTKRDHCILFWEVSAAENSTFETKNALYIFVVIAIGSLGTTSICSADQRYICDKEHHLISRNTK